MREQVFYTPATEVEVPRIIDFIKDNGRSEIYNESLEDMKKRYPDIAIGNYQDIADMTRKAFISPPEEITEDKWWKMLEVLPPVGWKNYGDTESFKMSERTYADITGICCRIGDKYYHLSDTITLSHEFIVDKCKRVS